MSAIERRLRALDAAWPDARDRVDFLARCLGWAFQCEPIRAADQERNLQGFRSIIEESGLPSEDVEPALVQALAPGGGADELRARQCVDFFGVDIMLGALALPSEHCEAYLLAHPPRSPGNTNKTHDDGREGMKRRRAGYYIWP